MTLVWRHHVANSSYRLQCHDYLFCRRYRRVYPKGSISKPNDCHAGRQGNRAKLQGMLSMPNCIGNYAFECHGFTGPFNRVSIRSHSPILRRRRCLKSTNLLSDPLILFRHLCVGIYGLFQTKRRFSPLSKVSCEPLNEYVRTVDVPAADGDELAII